MRLLAVAAALALAVVGVDWGGGGSATTALAAIAPAPAPGAPVTFNGQVNIGNGREVYLYCLGTGSPTIVLESGYHDGGSIWLQTETKAPASGPSVMQGLASTNRVCTYDRPGTLDYSENPPRVNTDSTPVTMPETAADVVADLHATLAAADIPGPYVLVAHSLGGLFALLYARTYPDQVVGMVLVDAFAPIIPKLFGSKWPAYDRLLNYPGVPQDKEPGWEVINIGQSVKELASAPPLRAGLPLAVLSHTVPFTLPRGFKAFSSRFLERIWNRGQNQLAGLEPQTPHMIATGSAHYIQVQQPDLVISATRLVIARAAG